VMSVLALLAALLISLLIPGVWYDIASKLI
jgi:hypothetical protein